MKVIDIINQRQGQPFASFEIVPPLKGTDAERLYNIIEPLMQLAPPFINITCHRDEVEYHPNADGTFTKLTLSKRPSTIAIVAAVMRRFPQVQIVPHVICGGASRHHVESELLDLRFLGIENVMALRGDALPGQRVFIPERDGFVHTNELVTAIASLNRGEYLDPNISATKSDHTFCVGVAGYPEKHFEAANMETDIENLRRKVEAGADYVVTQMFYSNEAFYRFRDACQQAGISVPIIPGLKPITTPRQVNMLPRTFHIDLPQPLVENLRRHPDDARKVGTEWCISQSQDLIAHGVPAIHYYTMGRPDDISLIVRSTF
ncbi:MAG: methylenetetrahydrofolate reductase [Prevotella sp.]|jgi:methylenetetrahydrofolate reductase (NADPH)|nr:methylenetetrahydrofolate reductase [Prevotella sp.]